MLTGNAHRVQAQRPQRVLYTFPSMPAASSPTICPSCGAQAEGRFCASCGAPLEGATCRTCAAPLTPGARFCHHCGMPVTGPAAPELGRVGSGSLPWIVASIALVALIVLVAAQRFRAPSDSVAPEDATPLGPPMTAPDISQLTPRERADRLYDRIMGLNARGRADSIQFFAQMAIPAYQALAPLDAGERYDMGRIAEVAGIADFARAQADTILREHPNHLLGLVLAIRAERLAGNEPAARGFERRLTAAERNERRRNLPEYERRRADIDAALEVARVEAPQ